MSAQLIEKFGGTWPSDAMGLALNPTKRIFWNHQVLVEMGRREQSRHADMTKPPNESGRGAASAATKSKVDRMWAERERMLAERRAMTGVVNND